MKARYKYENGPEGTMLVWNGDLIDLVKHIGTQANIVYSRTKDLDPEAARAFRDSLSILFSRPDSPVWTETVGVGNIDAFHVTRKGRCEG